MTTRKLYTGVRAAAPGSIEVVASTGAVDRQRDRVRPGGIQLRNYLANPIVTWAHRYDQLPVGRALEVTAGERDLRATIQFSPDAFGQQVYEHYRGGFLNAVSIGFQPLGEPRRNAEGGLDYDAVELLEIACVPVPANQEALVIARSMAGYGPDAAPDDGPLVFEFADPAPGEELVFQFARDPEPSAVSVNAAGELVFNIDPYRLGALIFEQVGATVDRHMTALTGRLPD